MDIPTGLGSPRRWQGILPTNSQAISSHRTLYVGDSPSDVEAAHACGLRAVGAAWASTADAAALRAAGADWVLASVGELRALVLAA